MLVLSRKSLEQIVIGSDIRITIVKLDRNQVRIGIEAPGDRSIVRAELLERQKGRDSSDDAPTACSDASDR